MKPTALTTPILVLIITLLLLVFSAGSIFAIVLIRRRRASRSQVNALPTILAAYAPGVSSLTPTISSLVAQSTLLATAPIRLGVMPTHIGPKAVVRLSMDFACAGLARSASWGKTTIGLFGLALSSSLGSMASSPSQAGSDTMSDKDMDDLEAGRPRLAYDSDSDSVSMPPTPAIVFSFPSSDLVFNAVPEQDRGFLFVEGYEQEEEEEEEEEMPVATVQRGASKSSIITHMNNITHHKHVPRIATLSMGIITEKDEE
ncbi:hypothetical protein OF83DRAFT_1175854 [Amylostereum chailletii]|nr:hypothetical protein OF83DRAFT_1175854 [Amylostereum chailletii]